MSKRTKIQKHVFTPAEVRVVLEAADLLAPYSRRNPSVEGLESKLRSAIAGSPDHAPGDMPTVIRRSEQAPTSDEMLEALGTVEKLRKAGYVDPDTTEKLRQTSRAVGLEYLEQMSPAAAAAWRAAEADRIRAASGL